MDNLTKTIIEHIKQFIIIVLKLNGTLFIKNILPFFCLVIILTIIVLKLQWNGLPIIIFIISAFFIMLFGPIILFKVISSENDFFKNLRFLAIYYSIQVLIILIIIFYKNMLKR